MQRWHPSAGCPCLAPAGSAAHRPDCRRHRPDWRHSAGGGAQRSSWRRDSRQRRCAAEPAAALDPSLPCNGYVHIPPTPYSASCATWFAQIRTTIISHHHYFASPLPLAFMANRTLPSCMPSWPTRGTRLGATRPAACTRLRWRCRRRSAAAPAAAAAQQGASCWRGSKQASSGR